MAGSLSEEDPSARDGTSEMINPSTPEIELFKDVPPLRRLAMNLEYRRQEDIDEGVLMMRPNYSSPDQYNSTSQQVVGWNNVNNCSNSNDFNRLETLNESQFEDRHMLRTEL